MKAVPDVRAPMPPRSRSAVEAALACFASSAVSAAAPREHWPQDPEHHARIEAEFDGAYGDRRQEIVFIGQHLEPGQTREILDRCLLTDVELAAGPEAWKTFDDPFSKSFAGHDEG